MGTATLEANEWADCENMRAMFDFCSELLNLSERRWWLVYFGHELIDLRYIPPSTTDPAELLEISRLRAKIAKGYEFADGKASWQEVYLARWPEKDVSEYESVDSAQSHARRELRDSSWLPGAAEEVCDMIRDIVGTPSFYVQDGSFRVMRNFNGVPWITRDVTNLAQHAYDVRNQDGTLDAVTLAVLADALEEAGCQVDELLFHLRGELGCSRCEGAGYLHDPEYSLKRGPCYKCEGEGLIKPHPPHYRGCWAVDALLGKE